MNTTLPLEKRAAVLDGAVLHATQRGWRTISRTPTQAQMVKGKNTSHLLHLVLSLITLGLWIPVWLAVAMFAGQQQSLVTVDEFGRISG